MGIVQRKPTIVVVDYHKGNLLSVAQGLEEAGAEACIADDPVIIAQADAVVLPGVGSFEDAMQFMQVSGQAEVLRKALSSGMPFLGICLGMQLLFSRGNESRDGSWIDGLDVLEGSVVRLESTQLKVPHVGWDQIRLSQEGRTCPLLSGVHDGSNVYFTHSYALAADTSSSLIVARTDYTCPFASVVSQGNIFGVQFHPEKSSAVGLQILSNFVKIAAGERSA